MNNPNVFKNPCPLCKKRETSRLCDYVIEYNNNVLFMRTYQDFVRENHGTKNITCNLPMCEECSIKTGVNVDMCPYHFKLYGRSKLPPELEKYAHRHRLREIQDVFTGNYDD